MKAPEGFGLRLLGAVKCLAVLALVWLALPAGVGMPPVPPAEAARSKQPGAFEKYVNNLMRKIKTNKKTTKKATVRKRLNVRNAAKSSRPRAVKKPVAAAVKAPKPAAKPAPPVSAATDTLADAPAPATPAPATSAPAAPELATASPAAPELATTSPPVRAPPETLAAEPADPRNRKTASSEKTALLIIPRPRPEFPETDEPPAAAPPGTLAAEPADPRSKKTAFGEKTATLIIPRPRPNFSQAGEPPAASPLTSNGNWQPEDVRAARLACEVELSGLDLASEESHPIGGPKGCGTAAPISLKSADGVKLAPPAIANCRMAAAFHRWVETIVQPAAERAFAERVTGLAVAASYDCRYRYNAAGGKVSEHARANAIDVSSFTLASGRRVEVLGGWQPRLVALNGEAKFLREVHKGGCTMFSTVLGPDANAAHASHFHLDLQPRKSRSRFCE
ncbi:MAG: extensin family protein [Pseudomonadota bacterium]|nr:extensin family protein [Pseudomonadota bacterium]